MQHPGQSQRADERRVPNKVDRRIQGPGAALPDRGEPAVGRELGSENDRADIDPYLS